MFNSHNSFGFLTKSTDLDIMQLMKQNYPDIFEIIPRSFGNLFFKEIPKNFTKTNLFIEILDQFVDSYVISYNFFAPLVLKKKFNRVIKMFMESGIESFYTSYSDFLSCLRKRINNHDKDEWKPLRLDQLQFFLIIYVIQILIAIGTFIAEILIHRKRTRENDRAIE